MERDTSHLEPQALAQLLGEVCKFIGLCKRAEYGEISLPFQQICIPNNIIQAPRDDRPEEV